MQCPFRNSTLFLWRTQGPRNNAFCRKFHCLSHAVICYTGVHTKLMMLFLLVQLKKESKKFRSVQRSILDPRIHKQIFLTSFPKTDCPLSMLYQLIVKMHTHNKSLLQIKHFIPLECGPFKNQWEHKNRAFVLRKLVSKS